MEDRSNKTIICSVLFLDIVEYSKKSVTGQISLKDRFNTYLSEAIHDVPANDRIILDTGDGAAVNFLGDVESALTAALRLRASLLAEDAEVDPPLLVRIGVNLGPVRLVRDINGQPNIVGDGINVAQRIMAFAEPSQILVSRSYFDAVSRLSAEYTGMFHYQGSRTDKHVREHEIYAIGYPGDQTIKRMPDADTKVPRRYVHILDRVRAIGRVVATPVSEKIMGANAAQRALYAAMVVVPLLMASVVFFMPSRAPAPAPVETMQSTATVPDSKPVKEDAQKPVVEKKDDVQKPAVEKSAPPVKGKPSEKEVALAKHKAELAKKAAVPAKPVEGAAKRTEAAKAEPDDGKPEPVKDAYISVSCKDEVQLFVDGANKGKFTTGTLTVVTKPGKHKVILTHASFGFFTDEVTTEAGKTERLKPKVCN